MSDTKNIEVNADLLHAAKWFLEAAETAYQHSTGGQSGKLADTQVGKQLIAAITKAEGMKQGVI